MGKNTARSLSESGKVFNKMLEGFMCRQDINVVFETLLDMFICGASYDKKYQEIRDANVQRFSDKEKSLLSNIFKEVFVIQHKEICDNGKPWHDTWGEMYEHISGNGKRSGMGQFFTPGHVCDMMVQMTINKEESGKRISDPCSGSGRFILASHAWNPRNFHYASDLDLLCCKMTVVNMFLHGVKGEAVHKNALDNTNYYQGWEINMQGLGIRELKREDSLQAKMDKNLFFEYHNKQNKSLTLQKQLL